MALLETEDGFPIQFLPIELIETVAVYLTPKDLAACCAVSHRMREIFDEDMLWRRHCNRELAEYLKTTPCKLEPQFVSPESENSTLSPVSYWRMAFMRENHLWNNWRQGKNKTEQIKNQHSVVSPHYDNSICHIFHTSDVILGFFRDRIELLDVREYPAADATHPIRLHSNFSQETQLKSGNNMILTLRETWIQVHEVNLSLKVCSLKHEFFFNNAEKLSNSETFRPNSSKKCIYTMVGVFFIGVIKGESTMHIWNLESGEKLKEEFCPLVRSCQIMEIKTSDTKNLVISVKAGCNDVIVLAYSLTTLTYLTFKVTYQSNIGLYVCENHVGIHINNRLDVYNYETTDLLLKDQAVSSHPQFLHNNFVFITNKTLTFFNPKTRVLKSTPITGLTRFEIMCNRFIQVKRNWENEIWEISGVFERVKKIMMNLWFDSCAFYLNRTCTRYIVRTGVGNVIHFW
uniref:F-box domain-containing protein n=1 Tax=Cuerna arida TaxID=1464854 RepID=A0A1B6GL16_9HEMI